MKTALAVFAAACVCISMAFLGSSGARALEWKKYYYPEYKFEVEFSGPVQVTPQSISARERTVRSTLYLQDGGSYAYSILAQLNSEGAGVNLDAAADGGFEVYGCKNINDGPFEFPSGRAKELSGDRCLGETYRAHARYFSKGDWLYAVTYLIKIDGGDISSAQRFLQSFKIDEN